MPGEKLRDFNIRVDQAAAEKIMAVTKRVTNTAIKKKEFLESKKKKKKDVKLPDGPVRHHCSPQTVPSFMGPSRSALEMSPPRPRRSRPPRAGPRRRTQLVALRFVVELARVFVPSHLRLDAVCSRQSLLLTKAAPVVAPHPARVAMLAEERERAVAAYR